MDHPVAELCHASHQLATLRGVLFCQVCGCHCVENPRNLKSECLPPTKAGHEVLSRLKRGLPPKSGDRFPDL
eukprot:7206108-Pyramimonas_sp.AAC.1